MKVPPTAIEPHASGPRRCLFRLAALAIFLPAAWTCAWAAGRGGNPSGEALVLPLEDLESPSLTEGARVLISGKYLGLVDQQLHLFGIPFDFTISDPALARQLLNLKTEVDNITLSGWVRKAPSDGNQAASVRIEVESIEPAPRDSELYGSRFKALLNAPGADAARIFKLAARISLIQKRFPDPALLTLLRQATAEVIKQAARKIDQNDADGLFAMLTETFKHIADDAYFGESLKQLATRFPTHAGIELKLRDLGYRQQAGNWLSYPEFKRGEGFVQHQNRWVKRLKKELLEVLDALPKEGLVNAILRSRTNKEYLNLSRHGEVARGMTLQEVAEALGFPERVERQGAGGQEVTQWDYGDKRYYFLKGELLLTWEDSLTSSSMAEAVKKAISGSGDSLRKKSKG